MSRVLADTSRQQAVVPKAKVEVKPKVEAKPKAEAEPKAKPAGGAFNFGAESLEEFFGLTKSPRLVGSRMIRDVYLG